MAALPTPTPQYDASNESQTRNAIVLELNALRALVTHATTASLTPAVADATYVKKSGDTMTGDLTIGTAGTALRRGVTYPGFGLEVPASAAVPDATALDVATADTLGLLLITASNGASALAVLAGGAHDTTVLAVRGTWSKTVGTAASLNVYWDGGASLYRLQNKSGVSLTFYITKVGDPVTL